MEKIMSVEKAIENIKDGDTIMIGGFGGNGSPHYVIDALAKKGVKNLTLICNDAAQAGFGAGVLVRNEQIKKMYVSIIGPNPEAVKMYSEGKFEMVLVPQGSLAEMIRAGGYGLGGILTKTGLGTLVEEGKQKVTIKGEVYLLEEALQADFALIFASRVDRSGNASYHGSARAHSPSMAFAAKYTIVEAEEIVEVGGIDPNQVDTPCVLVDAIVQSGGK
jgi:acetate CoA/acetoacetate CoA-transferase alpha subunit